MLQPQAALRRGRKFPKRSAGWLAKDSGTRRILHRRSIANDCGTPVSATGGTGAPTSLKTRGLRNEDTAILIDGQRLRDVAAPQGDATGLLSDLIFTNVDRLEVLRGSGSSLYGTNAIGGVVNILTDEGGGRTRGSLLTEGGSLGLFRGRAQVAGGINEDRVAYSVGVAHLNVAHGVDGDDAARNTSGQGRIRFQLTPRHHSQQGSMRQTASRKPTKARELPDFYQPRV